MNRMATRRTTIGMRLLAALTLALFVTALAGQVAEVWATDAKTVNDRATQAAHDCADEGGKYDDATTFDDEGNITSIKVFCKGGREGDWSCEIFTAEKSCTTGLVAQPGRINAALVTGAVLVATDAGSVRPLVRAQLPVRGGRQARQDDEQ